ncbi:MAG: NAD(P)/FAD-dependent oxidoreductase [Pirellulales bacterium]|nr:NAD(P)/FAD-dependent oxidoreductase [Pirellulales bacterium]
MENYDVAVIGGGPAGLMGAERAAARGRRVVLLEKNRRPGIKILLSGGTRCNLTHATDARGIAEAFGPAGRFLRSALAALGPQEMIDLFTAEGAPTKIEPGGKVFPASDRASDVLAALVRRAKRSGVELALAEPLLDLAREDGRYRLTTPRRTISAEKVLLATGGKSYPACGTIGDGYRFAAALGHTIVPPRPALTPITSHAEWVTALQGVSVTDAVIEVIETNGPDRTALTPSPSPGTGEGRKRLKSRGALLFTHFGVSGPAVLDVSREVSGHEQPSDLLLRCDLLPELTEEEILDSWADASATTGRRQVAGLVDSRLPRRLAEAIVAQSGLPGDLTAAEFSKRDRRQMARRIKRFDVPVAGTMGFRKAEVTAGGVTLEEVDGRTMQSRVAPNLYLAGELLDLDGPIGGYNFQAAFSTGRLAGESV